MDDFLELIFGLFLFTILFAFSVNFLVKNSDFKLSDLNKSSVVYIYDDRDN